MDVSNQHNENQNFLVDSNESQDSVKKKTTITFGVQNIPQVSIKMGGDSNDPDTPGSKCDS